MQITIPFKTPNVNNVYWHKGNMKIIKRDARKIREDIMKIVQEPPADYRALFNRNLKVLIDIYENWYFMNGNVSSKDVSNREKFLIDSIFLGLGIDDRMIFDLQIRKIQDTEKEQAVVTIEVI